ncbi:unnamed protein product [Spirodela intermedia]|uniref:Gnk2-homologous domain-containing protein n=1 Tax=Spirodela intermedia TaxID=51605 RepID=A0A7I8KPB7_SPIIN|nr:unnamed protein product [Spirodela intermedia]
MAIPRTSQLFRSLAVLLAAAVLVFAVVPAVTPAAEPYDLVYKGCANQSFPSDGLAYPQALAALSSALVAKSAASMFYKTTTAGGGGQPSLFGLFQCRGDLSAADCAACVGRIPAMWGSLCGQTTAARIQLSGCYGLYEISGFPQVSGTKMLYKECGRSGGAGGGFEEKRDTAFASLESAMAAGSAGGFYAAGNGNLRVMAQCEGDLSVADCAECVTESVQKAEVECGGASSGRMYLDKCYLSYGSFPDGGGGGGGGGEGGGGGASGTQSVRRVADSSSSRFGRFR